MITFSNSPNVILAASDEIPVPQWHLEIVRERVSAKATAQLNSWNEAKQRLMSKYREC